MKTITLFAVLLVFSLTGVSQKLSLDIEKSSIEWTGKKVGGQHNGDIDFISGYINKSEEGYSSGEFLVDMNSLTVDDITDADTNAKLVGHLKSDDFFGVADYPNAKLSVKKGVLQEEDIYEFEGYLTIKGKTKAVKITANMLSINGLPTFFGQLIVDRSDFDVRYGSGSFFDNLGDNVIYDDFILNFKVIFTK